MADVIDTGYEVSLKSQICYCDRFGGTSATFTLLTPNAGFYNKIIYKRSRDLQ